MRFSYSNVSTFGSCPYRWYLHYIKKLRTLPETNADNPLILGLALHKGVETGSVDEAIKEYNSHYNILTDENVNWQIQLEYQVPKVLELLPTGGEHELEVKLPNFLGYIDYVCGDTLYDFKFSNNIESYSASPQLSIYKHFLEKVRPDLKINHLVYVFVPKIKIRQRIKAKPPETLNEFRQRLNENLEATEIKLVEVPYMTDAIGDFKECCKIIENTKDFPKNKSKLCSWCEYKSYCQSDGSENWMII